MGGRFCPPSDFFEDFDQSGVQSRSFTMHSVTDSSGRTYVHSETTTVHPDGRRETCTHHDLGRPFPSNALGAPSSRRRGAAPFFM